MKQLKRYILLFIIGTLPLFSFAQQDPQYSLYMFDKMAVDPAAAGSKDDMELNLISRDQWLDIPGAPITNALLFSAPIQDKHAGWGIEIMNDRIGPTQSSSLQGNYAYNIRIGNGKLAMGLGIGLYDYTFDFSQVDYKDQNDVYAMANNGSKITPTAEAGLYYHTQTYYVGFSFNHLIESRLTNITTDSSASFKPHAYFIAGKSFQSASGVIWNPSIIIQYANNAPLAASINLNVLLINKLWLGASYKPGYGFVLLAAYRATNAISVGYAYDLGLNNIGTIGGGSHELSLSISFGSGKVAQVSPRFF